jgi:hypothetical protein
MPLAWPHERLCDIVFVAIFGKRFGSKAHTEFQKVSPIKILGVIALTHCFDKMAKWWLFFAEFWFPPQFRPAGAEHCAWHNVTMAQCHDTTFVMRTLFMKSQIFNLPKWSLLPHQDHWHDWCKNEA